MEPAATRAPGPDQHAHRKDPAVLGFNQPEITPEHTPVNHRGLRLRVPAGGLTGLAQDSDVMVDKLTTVRRSNVQVRIGRLSSQQMVELERLLMTFLGMAR